MSDVNPCISQDIWFEILKELPVKTLGKCRCVCKSWDSLIVSPPFMAAHLKNYTQNEANSLLLYREMSPKIRQFEQYVLFKNCSLEVYHTSICPFKIHGDFSHCSYFVGSVHGLLCLSDDPYLSPTRSQIMVFNPLLRKYIKLPVSTTASNNMGDHTSVLGFGYDGIKNDHKVVKISNCRVKDVSLTTTPRLVEVYSVQEQSWSTITTDYFVDNIRSLFSSQCFINGVIHWLTWEVLLGKWLLLFNVSTEKFEKMELPDALLSKQTSRSNIHFGVFEFRNKLSVSECEYMLYDFNYATHCQIWTKEDYNGGSLWCKILNVLFDCNCIHIGPVEYLGRNGELVGFARESDKNMSSYDPLTRKFTDLGLRQHLSTRFSDFTESLVLLNQKTDVYTDEELQRSVVKRPQICFAEMIDYDDLIEFELELEDENREAIDKAE